MNKAIDNKKLLPCPFCGGEALFDSVYNESGTCWASYVFCSDCGCMTDECGGDNRDEKTRDTWNTRAIDNKSWTRCPELPSYIEPVEVVFKPYVGINKCIGTYFPKPGIFEDTLSRHDFRIDEVAYWMTLSTVIPFKES